VLVNISADQSLGMREVTTATSIIQSEAGENAEIIMGTVLDESMGNDLRMTVIATGFDLSDDQKGGSFITVSSDSHKKAHSERPRGTAVDGLTGRATPPRTEELTKRFISPNDPFYKGEKNLKQLDTPAVHRRGVNIQDIASEDSTVSTESELTPSYTKEETQTEAPRRFGTGNVLLNNREERINKGDSDQPAFLRRAMD
jgi:cell division protein FtsZ